VHYFIHVTHVLQIPLVFSTVSLCMSLQSQHLEQLDLLSKLLTVTVSSTLTVINCNCSTCTFHARNLPQSDTFGKLPKKKKKKEMGDKAALHTQTQKQLQPHGRAQQVGGERDGTDTQNRENIYCIACSAGVTQTAPQGIVPNKVKYFTGTNIFPSLFIIRFVINQSAQCKLASLIFHILLTIITLTLQITPAMRYFYIREHEVTAVQQDRSD